MISASKKTVVGFIGLAMAFCAATSFADQAPDPAQLELGKTVFTSKAVPACTICHTLKDAGSSGAIGPDLDELKPDHVRVVQAVTEGIGAMPSFAATLSKEEIEAVAAYVVHTTDGKP